MSAAESKARRLTAAQCMDVAQRLSMEFAEKSAERDRERIIAYDAFDTIRGSGLTAMRVPVPFGGPGCSIAEMVEIMRLIAKGDSNIAQAMSANYLVADALLLWGSAAQQKKYMQAMLDGKIINNAFAERGTKFVGQINTVLTKDGAGYRMNGFKFYSTGALMADEILVSAKTEDGVPALLIIPRDRAGMTLVDDWTGMGQRTTASGTTTFKDVRVERDEIMMLPDFATKRSFFGAFAQITHAAIDTGIAAAALEDAIALGHKTRPTPDAGVERQIDDPYAISTIGHMTVLVHQAEAMLKRSADFLQPAVDAQLMNSASPQELERLLIEASVAVAEAKISATEASLRVSEMLYLIGGASATLSENNYDRHWRNARTHTTHDPVSYKYRLVGDYFLSGKTPPLSTKV